MIIVTGAAGKLGREIVEQLLARLPPERIIASAREPLKVAALTERGVQVRSADFADAKGLSAAFSGAEQVLVMSVDKLGDVARQLHQAAISAARQAGARRVLYTSHMGARVDSPFVPACDHAATEAMLAEGGHPFTSLRHGFYAESGVHMIGKAFETGELRVPEDGPVSWTARNDLAEADALLLAEEGRLNGLTPPLTAPQAFTMAELAAIASELIGREVKHVTITDNQWLEERVAQGAPRLMAEMLLGMYQAARRGDFATVDPTLELLLGRRPQTMRDVLASLLKPASA